MGQVDAAKWYRWQQTAAGALLNTSAHNNEIKGDEKIQKNVIRDGGGTTALYTACLHYLTLFAMFILFKRFTLLKQ